MSSNENKPPVTKESNQIDKKPEARLGITRLIRRQCHLSTCGCTSGWRNIEASEYREKKKSCRGTAAIPLNKSQHSFRKRQKRKQHKSPKLCWGLTTTGELSAHPIGTCAQQAVKCMVEFRANKLKNYVKRHPDMKKHYMRLLPIAELQCKQTAISQTQRNIERATEGNISHGNSFSEFERLQNLMSGCHIDATMRDADQLTEMVDAFHLRNDLDASSSGLGRQLEETYASQCKEKGIDDIFQDSDDDL